MEVMWRLEVSVSFLAASGCCTSSGAGYDAAPGTGMSESCDQLTPNSSSFIRSGPGTRIRTCVQGVNELTD